MARSFVLLLGITIAFLGGLAASAQEHHEISLATRFAQSDVVLVGRVTEAKGSSLDVTLTVLRSWKGPYASGETVHTITPCAGRGCAISVNVGDELLIFSRDGPQVSLARGGVFQGAEATSMVAALDAQGLR
jgi:hypothetical protein